MDQINMDRLLWVDVRNSFKRQAYLYKGYTVKVIGQIGLYYELEVLTDTKVYFESVENFLNHAKIV